MLIASSKKKKHVSIFLLSSTVSSLLTPVKKSDARAVDTPTFSREKNRMKCRGMFSIKLELVRNLYYNCMKYKA